MYRSTYLAQVCAWLLILAASLVFSGPSLAPEEAAVADLLPDRENAGVESHRGESVAVGSPIVEIPAEVKFMRSFIARVNPGLGVEDAACARELPEAIFARANDHEMDWRQMLALAWQESDFDCHAKNPRDKGGAYGAFQIRRLWTPVIGDPRRDYFNPHLAADRAAKVLTYYRATSRHQELVARRFRYPTLCLYNTGERLKINMRYCRSVGSKARLIEKAWRSFRSRHIAALIRPT